MHYMDGPLMTESALYHLLPNATFSNYWIESFTLLSVFISDVNFSLNQDR